MARPVFPQQGAGSLPVARAVSSLEPGHDRKPGRATWKDLLLLGISGGMVPCPSALVVLLTSIAFDAAWVGLILIAAFSGGLAAVLVGIGVGMVLAGKLVSGRGRRASIAARFLPFVSGTAVTAVGAAIAVKGLAGLFPQW